MPQLMADGLVAWLGQRRPLCAGFSLLLLHRSFPCYFCAWRRGYAPQQIEIPAKQHTVQLHGLQSNSWKHCHAKRRVILSNRILPPSQVQHEEPALKMHLVLTSVAVAVRSLKHSLVYLSVGLVGPSPAEMPCCFIL